MSGPMLKAIIIDPYTRTVTSERIEGGSIDALYDAIGNGCDTFQVVFPECIAGESLYCDEEGKLGGQSAMFLLRTWGMDPFAGRCVILGHPDNWGNDTSTTWTPEEVEEFVTWL